MMTYEAYKHRAEVILHKLDVHGVLYLPIGFSFTNPKWLLDKIGGRGKISLIPQSTFPLYQQWNQSTETISPQRAASLVDRYNQYIDIIIKYHHD